MRTHGQTYVVKITTIFFNENKSSREAKILAQNEVTFNHTGPCRHSHTDAPGRREHRAGKETWELGPVTARPGKLVYAKTSLTVPRGAVKNNSRRYLTSINYVSLQTKDHLYVIFISDFLQYGAWVQWWCLPVHTVSRRDPVRSCHHVPQLPVLTFSRPAVAASSRSSLVRPHASTALL